VTGVSSHANADLLGKLGASKMIDYKIRDPTQATGFDLVFDSVTTLPFSASRKMLKRAGTWVGTRFSGALVKARLLAPLNGRRVHLVTVKPNGEQLERIGALLATGQVETLIEETYPITEIAAAHARSPTGRVRGKIAIDVS